MSTFGAIVFAVWASLLFSGPAFADKRVALVIGNSSYKYAPKLTNPENDAAAISLLLKNSGFDIVEARQNLSGSDMRRSMREFSENTRDADIAVVFYAGHGIEVGGTNYLIPVDTALRKDIDVEDEAVSLDRVLMLLEPAKRLRLIILDACRDNPFTSKMTRTLASRSVGRGLGKVEPPNSDTLIAYAARGSTSADGDGVNSPFTAALLRNLTTPGLDIRLALGRVHDEVVSKTGKKQEPFVYGALGGATISLASLTAEPRDEKVAPAAEADADVQASRDYEFAAKVGTSEAWESFLKRHPKGFYSDLATAQRNKLIAPIASPADPKPKPAAKLEAAAPGAKSEPPEDLKKKSTGNNAADETKPKTKKVSSGGSQMDCCVRYKLRQGISISNSEGACRNHIWMQRTNPAQAGVSNWCSL